MDSINSIIIDLNTKINYSTLSNVSKIILADVETDTIALHDFFEKIKLLPNLKFLNLIIGNRFTLPKNIEVLKQIKYLKIVMNYAFMRYYSDYDTTIIDGKKYNSRLDLNDKKNYKLPYFVYKVEDEIFNLENLEYLAISHYCPIKVNKNKIEKLSNLKGFIIQSDSVFNFNIDLNKNKKLEFVRQINLPYPFSFNRGKPIERKQLPELIYSGDSVIKYFSTSCFKLTKSDKNLIRLKNLRILNTYIFKDFSKLPCEVDSLPNLNDILIYSRSKRYINKKLFTKNNSLRRVYFNGKYLPQNITIIPNLKELFIEKVKKGYENLSFLSDSVKQLSVLDVDLSKVINSIQNHHFNKIVIPITDLLKSTIEQLNCIDADTLEISNLRTTEFYKLDKEHFDYNYYKNFREGEWYKTYYVHYNKYISKEYLKVIQASKHFKVITYTN